MSKEELLERIASLIVAETPIDQIALVTEMTNDEITTIRDSAECKRLQAVLMAEEIEERQNMNRGWDSVENIAIGVVLDNLKWNKDAKFALQAAAQANRAVRRGKNGNEALNAANGARAVINLQMNFVKHLENSTRETVTIDAANLEKKMVDCMEPTSIEKLLDAGSAKIVSVQTDLEDALPEFNMQLESAS